MEIPANLGQLRSHTRDRDRMVFAPSARTQYSHPAPEPSFGVHRAPHPATL